MKKFAAVFILILLAVISHANAQFMRHARGTLTFETVGRSTRSGVVIGSIASGATLSGTNANHLTVTSGVVSINSTGQGSLAATYSLTITGDPSYTTLFFNTDVNTYTVNTNAEASAAITNAASTDNTQFWYVYYRSGSVAADSATITKQFVGTVSNPTAGITLASGSSAIYAAINPAVANPTGSVSGGGVLMGCRTTLACSVSSITLNGISPLIIDNLNFTAKPSSDSYDAKFTFITQPVRWTPTVDGSGAITGVGSVTQTGIGFLVPGGKRAFTNNKISGAGTGFTGYFTTNADGTIDGSSVLTITAPGSGYTTGSVIGQDLNGSQANAVSQQTNTLPAGGVNQLVIGKNNCTTTLTIASPAVFTCSSHGYVVGTRLSCSTTGAMPTGITPGEAYYVVTVPTSSTYTVSATPGGSPVNTSGSQSGTHTCGSVPNIIIRHSQFGNVAESSALRTAISVRVNSVGTFVFEDNVIDWFYKGIFFEGCDQVDVRRNWFKHYTNDVIDLYPSVSVGTQVNGTTCSYRDYNNVISDITQSLNWTNSHADMVQWLAVGDLQSYNVIIAFDYWFVHSDIIYTTSQGIIGDTVPGLFINAWVRNNLIITSTTNSMQISNGLNSSANDFSYNTTARSNYANYGSTCGAWSSCGWTSAGTKESIEPAFAASTTGVVYTLSNNIVGQFWELTPLPVNTYSSGDGTRTRAGQSWQYTTVATCYLDVLTQNTSAGNSFPENLAGPFSSYGGANVGYYQWWSLIRNDTAAHIKTDLDAMFATIPGSSCDGKGYRVVP